MPIGFENLVMSNLAESMFSKDLQTDESHLEEKVARPVKQLWPILLRTLIVKEVRGGVQGLFFLALGFLLCGLVYVSRGKYLSMFIHIRGKDVYIW